jgi:hypothetical protein
MALRFIGCTIVFLALAVGISLVGVGLCDSERDDFRDVVSFVVIVATLCLVAAALLLFLRYIIRE